MTTPPAGTTRRPPVLWSVVEEHLSEASFLWAQWEGLLNAPDHTLAEVLENDEPRLLAHVEGLVLGGRPVARRLLLPLLEGGEDLRTVCVAAYTLLHSTTEDWLGELLARLQEGDEALRQGLLRALELSGREDISSALLRRLPGLEPGLLADILGGLRHRRCDPGELISRVGDAPAALQAAAVRAACFAPLPLATALVRRGLSAEDGSVRLAALETGLLRGLPMAWEACRSSVEAGGAEARLGLFALAVGGTARALEEVVAATAKPSLRDEALWALGFSGRLAAAEALFHVLKEDGSPLAAESFAAITGLPMRPPFMEPVEEHALDTEAPPEATGEAGNPKGPLPAPAVVTGRVEVGEVERWWARARGQLNAEARYLYGHAYDTRVLLAALNTLPMRRRGPMVLDVAIRSQGLCLIEPRDWASVQYRQAQTLKQVRPRNLVVAFESLHGAAAVGGYFRG